MAEIDHEKRSWVAASIIGIWTVLTLFHDACAVQAEVMIGKLMEGESNSTIPLVLSLLDVALCASAITVANGKVGSYLESICIAGFAHLFGTFLTYKGAQDISAPEYGFLGSLLEPAMCLLLLYLCKGVFTNLSRAFSVAVISLGFLLASLNMQAIRDTDRRFVITMLCGTFYTLRNIVVAFWHEEGVLIERRNSKALMATLSVVITALVMLMILQPVKLVIPLAFAVFTCCVHAYLTYITSAVLLAKVSVPTLCLLNVCVQFIENQVLMTSSHRPNMFLASVACVFIMMGVYLYAVDAVETGHAFHTWKEVTTNEMLTRIQFLLFVSCILGVLFYVLQPRVSPRDLDNLSIVGLDKVIRRLLSIEQPAGHEH